MVFFYRNFLFTAPTLLLFYKKRVINKGEHDQYYIENHHEAIVSRELWEKANELLVRKKTDKKLNLCGDYSDFSGKYPLSKKSNVDFVVEHILEGHIYKLLLLRNLYGVAK